MDAIEQATAKFVRNVHRAATVMQFRVELDDTMLPAFAVLRFPARRKAVLLAGCYHLGHDCRRGRPCEPLDPVTRGQLARHCQCLQSAAEEALAAERLAVSTIWECERPSMVVAGSMLHELMSSRRNQSGHAR